MSNEISTDIEPIDFLMDESGDKPPEGSHAKPEAEGLDENLEEIVPDEEESEKDEESEEESEEDGEDKGEDEEVKFEAKDEEIEFLNLPRRKDILKKFPELFKEFPAIERAIYRENQYTDIFPSPDDAKEAVSKLEDYKLIEQELMEGSIENILDSVKNSNPDAFKKITAEFLQTLGKVDRPAYLDAVSFVTKSVLHNAITSARQSGDKQLFAAAQIIHRYVYDSPEVTPPTQVQPQREDPEKGKLAKEREEYNMQRLTDAANSVGETIQNHIKANIDKNIDPKGVMSPYVRDKAKQDVLTAIDAEIAKDKRFMQHKERLWEECSKQNYSQVAKQRIRDAFLQKVKLIFPEVLQRVRGEALKGLTHKREGKSERPLAARRPATSSPNKGKTEVPAGVSTLEFLSQD